MPGRVETETLQASHYLLASLGEGVGCFSWNCRNCGRRGKISIIKKTIQDPFPHVGANCIQERKMIPTLQNQSSSQAGQGEPRTDTVSIYNS